jgi:MYXO-CTERM domain-containing protein
MSVTRLTRFLAVAVAATAAVGAHRASAATLVSDNFDGYANQAAFEAVWPAIGTAAPLSAELSTAQASSAPNSIRVPGNSTTNGNHRNRRTFADTALLTVGTPVTWSFDFYDSAPTSGPARNFSNLQDTTAPSGTNQLIAMGFNNNQTNAQSGGAFYMARILGYNPIAVADPDGGPAESVGGAGAFFKLNDFGGSVLRSLGWHNLKVVISTDDGLSTDFEFYVDNVLSERVSNVGTAASIRQYDNITLGSALSNAGVEAFFDNVNLSQVPEPASAGMAGLVGLALAAVRRRRG